MSLDAHSEPDSAAKPLGPAHQPRQRAREIAKATLREHGVPLAIVVTELAVFASGVKLGLAPPPNRDYWAPLYFRDLIRFSLIGLAVALVSRLLFGWRSPRDALQQFRKDYLNPVSVVGIVFGALIVVQSFVAHDLWKTMLVMRADYRWDEFFMQADRFIFGADPWRLVAPWFDTNQSLYLLDTAYWLWYTAMAVLVTWMLVTSQREVRRRLLVTRAFVWVSAGILLAHSFSSGGPAFYSNLVDGADPFARLLARLDSAHAVVDLTARHLHGHVWANVEQGGNYAWLGMSAMPSMHVAALTMYALALWGPHKLPSLIVWSYTGVVFVGSVMLAWHYALDGIVGALVALGAWALAGRVVETRSPSGAERS